MTIRPICLISAVALLLMGASPRAADPPALPPAAGLSESAAKERAALFAALAASNNEADAREIEKDIWLFWLKPADEASQRLLDGARDAQLQFAYGTALVHLYELVRHQPRFAEGWNQLAYVLFLAGSFDASLEALERTLELEPMHYAALAGRGIILLQQGKDDEAQIALRKALAINPWLKERNLIAKPPGQKI